MSNTVRNSLIVVFSILFFVITAWQVNSFMTDAREGQEAREQMAVMIAYGFNEYRDDLEYPRSRFELPNGEFFEHEGNQYGRVDHRVTSLIEMRECQRQQSSFLYSTKEEHFEAADVQGRENIEAPIVMIMCVPVEVVDGVISSPHPLYFRGG